MKLLKSRKGFTLIELLVVIGILAVLAAIAIPSVAGLIDRANVSADKTNANEMTNAVERFTSEYELYCQGIASGAIKDADNDGVPDDMDGAQGRVYNVTKAVTRADITALESDGLNGRQISRDTKYPVNTDTFKAVVENYTKTSSSTFEPKQSDCAFYYSPDCGVVVCQETNASSVAELNALIQSGKDAKGNELDDSVQWFNITANIALGDDSGGNNTIEVYDGKIVLSYIHYEDNVDPTFGPFELTWEELISLGIYDVTNTSIKEGTFSGAPVVSVVVPNTITTIEAGAFNLCSVESVTLQYGLVSIGADAFSYCGSLHTIKFTGTVEQWHQISKGDNWQTNGLQIICLNGVVEENS